MDNYDLSEAMPQEWILIQFYNWDDFRTKNIKRINA